MESESNHDTHSRYSELRVRVLTGADRWDSAHHPTYSLGGTVDGFELLVSLLETSVYNIRLRFQRNPVEERTERTGYLSDNHVQTGVGLYGSMTGVSIGRDSVRIERQTLSFVYGAVRDNRYNTISQTRRVMDPV